MPSRGTKPKPDDQKRNRVPLRVDWTDVPDVEFVDPPPLPRRTPAWPAGTRAWWSAISTMPHCALWERSDWQFAIATAHVHAAFMGGDLRAAPELRNREKILGTTVDARRDLRIRYVDPTVLTADEQPAPVAKIDDRRLRSVANAS